MKIWFLVIMINLVGHGPVFVSKQAVNTENGYKPVRSMQECRKVAAERQHNLSVTMHNHPDIFRGEPKVICRELGKRPWVFKGTKRSKKSTQKKAVPAHK